MHRHIAVNGAQRVGPVPEYIRRNRRDILNGVLKNDELNSKMSQQASTMQL